MKKILTFLLSMTMVCGSAAFAVACGGGNDGSSENLCAVHIDENTDYVCDVCGEPMEEEEEEDVSVDVNVTFTVKDLEENILPNVTVILTSENKKNITVVSGEDGSCSVVLKTGTYKVMYDYDVDALGYYQSNTTSITVKKDTTALSLYLENKTPNGTSGREFPLDIEENEITIPANTTYYYIVYRVVNYYAMIEGATAKVTYRNAVYTPDEFGVISVKLLGSNTNATEILQIENTSNVEQTYGVNITSAPGSSENPNNLPLDSEITTGEIEIREVVYYTYTATQTGTLTITLLSENAYLSMMNVSTYSSVNTNEAESMTISISVNAGNTVKIECMATASESETAIVTFIAVFTAGE